MATSSHAQAVKSLNKYPGRRRFVFKTFSQRIKDIDINVYRSFDKIKSQPSEGSSFFRDCLIEWRELNTAKDFILFCEKMTPFVQTLPLVLLHKDEIFAELLSRLKLQARLSLEPILRLIAALSRDLLQDFIPLLARVADSLESLLKSGADREPEIVEQIFTSWSYIMMNLQRYLTRDIVHVLKVTVKLRYYPKDYVQEFMAEATSFLLRNAPFEQLIKGIRKILFEVAKKPLGMRKTGASALLCYAMRGKSTGFHSRAKQVLGLLMDQSIFAISDKFSEGPNTVVEVVIAAFQRLCEELGGKELSLIWNCLYQETVNCITNGDLLHLSCLLLLLISTVQSERRMVYDYQQMLELVELLVRKFIMPSGVVKGENILSEVVDKVPHLMLCILDGLHLSNNMSIVSGCSLQWAPVFQIRNSSLLTFIRELVLKDPCILTAFKENILSAISDLIETSQEEVICLLLSFCERLQMNPQHSSFLDGVSEAVLSRLRSFLQGAISDWIKHINDDVLGNLSSTQIHESKLALLWGIIRCFTYLSDVRSNSSLLMDLVDALDSLLMIEAENIAGVHKLTWQSLIGAALGSYLKWYSGRKFVLEETSKFLHLAKTYRSSSHVLFSVAEYLDYAHGPKLQAGSGTKIYHPELNAENLVEAVGIFADNLCQPDKGIRVPTLRILCHYVLQLLLSIEATPLSITTSRKITLLISTIHMDLSSGRISETYIPCVLNGLIGIYHDRFSSLWIPASECLAFLIEKHVGLVWDKFVLYFKQCLSIFQTSHDQLDRVNSTFSEKSSDLVEHFNVFVAPPSDSTPCPSVLTSLLQALQKIPSVVESRSRHVIPLFLMFLGYNNDYLESVGSFNSNACKGKEWKGALKEWLNLLKLMRNPRSLYQSKFLKDVLQNRFLDENDAETQMKVLDCLSMWKDDFLVPYDQHLKNLISSKNLREELTTWSLSKESYSIEEGHRPYIVPLIIRLLMPKVRKLKTLASRKHASVNHRKAVLGFIAQLDVEELPLFFAMLIKPLQTVGTPNLYWTIPSSVDEFQASTFLKYFTVENIIALSWKKRYGILHVIEDVIGVFDEYHARPFLDLLMGLVVRVLVSCSLSIGIAKGIGPIPADNHTGVNLNLLEKVTAKDDSVRTSAVMKQFKDLRSFCLKIVSILLNKYEDHDFGYECWDLFFISVKPLIDGFKQEGSTSEKPSSLFSCFLAMSRSQRLVSQLNREKNLVSDIFSILTVTTASGAIVSCVLSFIENLLNLDSELDDKDSAIKSIVLSNLEVLACSLHYLFRSDSATKRKLVKYPGEQEIRIFKLLSKYIKDPSSARKFVDILLPFLAKGDQHSDVCTEAMQVIRDIVPVLGSESTSKILNGVSSLLVSAELDMRLCICDLLDAVAKTDPSVVVVANLLRKLNATSAVEIGDLDYDTIVNAYQTIGVSFFYSIRGDHAFVILSHCVYGMSLDGLILRHSAYRSLVSFVEFSALILGRDVTEHNEMPKAMTKIVGGCWTRACIKQIIDKILLKHIGDAMNRGSSVKKEWIDLLREMVLKLPEVDKLYSFKALCSEDAEVDFFNNIIHLQKHRRARALTRFRNVSGTVNMSERIINKVFIPLFFNMLFDVQDGKGENLRTACLEALASISAQMEWKSYYALLLRCFREMNMNPDKQKVLLRLICSILDQFRFSVDCSSLEAKNVSQNGLGAETITNSSSDCSSLEAKNVSQSGLGAETITTSSSAALQQSGGIVILTEIQTCLHKTLLPKIQKLLHTDSGKVNVNSSLAALKLLKLLPEDIMDSQLPSIIHRISNFLKSRAESVRDEARLALAACLKELGLEFLQFMLGILRATLKRGYELHVLGYTLNFILSKSLPNSIGGKLDCCLEDLLSIVENDILGDVAEEKEVEKLASKMKETRKRKSFETLKLIAQSVTFRNHALKILYPVTAHLQKHPTPKVKSKLECMLNHIAAGIESNPSVDQTDLFIFVYGLVEDGIKEENGLGENSSSTEANKHCRNVLSRKKISGGPIIRSKSMCSHLITVFALGLLHTRLKKAKLDKNDEPLLSMLDPFVKLLGNCLSSKYQDILSASLRCLTPLLRLPLPSLESQADKIKATLLEIAQNSVDSSSPLLESCLRLLMVLLRTTKITLSSEQLHLLIQFPIFVDLERNPSFVALSLLKAVVKRKLVVHEIYDLVIRVAELMVTSQVESIRNKSSQILLQFLRGYHLSGKRLQQHLDFLLSNLRQVYDSTLKHFIFILKFCSTMTQLSCRYEHSSGREAVLEMLHAIIVKCPEDIVDEQSHTLFVHLVVCLANDHDNKVRFMTGAAIKLLIGRVSPSSRHSFLEYCLSWYLVEKQQLCAAGAQVLGLLVEVIKKDSQMEKDFQRHIDNLIPVTRRILQSAVKVVTTRNIDPSNGATILFWKEAYYSLVMWEKILHHFHDLPLERDLEEIWEAICELLLHPHMWLRNISSRLVALYFATVTKASREKSLATFFLTRPSRLFMIAVSFCCQLKAQLIDDDSANNLIMQNHVFAIGLHYLMGQREVNPHEFWSTLEQHEQARFLKAFQLLDPRKGRGLFLSFTSGVQDHNGQHHSEDLRYRLVSNLLKKMGKIALEMEVAQMKIIFNTFVKILSQINQGDCQCYAFQMLLPLYKVCEGFAGKVIPDDMKQLAEEVRDNIRNTLGSQDFVQVYSDIRKNIKAKREKRKQEEKLMAVVNPMRNAKRKMRIAAKHHANKKRKIMSI
ncbi:LOW QUALITY PROTEIN: DRIM domain-containing protein, partial [Cephalotus follicularis]